MNNNNQNKIMDRTGAMGRVGVAGAVEASGVDVAPGWASDRRVMDMGHKVTDPALDNSKTIGRDTGRRTRVAKRVLDRKARALTRDTDPVRDMVSALGRASGAGVASTASVSGQVLEVRANPRNINTALDTVSGAGAGEIVLNSPKKTRLPF